MLKRVRSAEFVSGHFPAVPFVLDTKMTDIPATMAKAIANLPERCVAVTCGRQPTRHRAIVEEAGRQRGVRIIWVRGPYG